MNRQGGGNTAHHKKGETNMKAYEIEYKIDGKCYTCVECPTKGWESQFLQNVLNRIESIVNAGAVVTRLTEINKEC